VSFFSLAAGSAGEQPLVHIRGCHRLAVAGHLLPRFQGRRDECAAEFFARGLSRERIDHERMGRLAHGGSQIVDARLEIFRQFERDGGHGDIHPGRGTTIVIPCSPEVNVPR
jgi:hypothetical protein